MAKQSTENHSPLLHFRAPQGVASELAEVARKQDRSQSDVMLTALTRYLAYLRRQERKTGV